MIVTLTILYSSSPIITTSYIRPREKPSSGIIELGLTTLLLCFQLALGGFLFSGGWNKTAILKNTQQEIITHRQMRTFPKSVEQETKFDAKTLKETVCCSSQYVAYCVQNNAVLLEYLFYLPVQAICTEFSNSMHYLAGDPITMQLLLLFINYWVDFSIPTSFWRQVPVCLWQDLEI